MREVLRKRKNNKYIKRNMNTLKGKFKYIGMIRKSKLIEEKQTEIREKK